MRKITAATQPGSVASEKSVVSCSAVDAYKNEIAKDRTGPTKMCNGYVHQEMNQSNEIN